MRPMVLLATLILSALPASAQPVFTPQFDHTTILVSDLEASVVFYRDILQLTPLDTPFGASAPIRFFALGGARQLHVGVAAERTRPDKNVHLAFAIREFDAFLRFLREQGVAYEDFPGASRDPQVRPDGVRQVYLQDPDGNWIEINDAVHPTP